MFKSIVLYESEGDSIKVFVRVRPHVNEVDHGSCLEVDVSRNAIIMQSKPEKVFTFDQVADMSITQGTLFCSVGRKIIESCVGGYNGTIFAYGQTGSGKTFTMLGPSENSDNFEHELRGVIPRSFEYLFQLIQREKEMHGDKVQFLTKCSFLEIYNEQIFDLLDEGSAGLQLRENIKKGVFVDGLIEQAVNNAAEAYSVLSTGWMNRTVASTSMNRESSRSHAVFNLCIESKTLNNGVWTMKASHLNLVDLAGSERQKDTHTTGARLKEAGSINKSLSVLGNVIMSLVDIAQGKTRHVPYRDSKLSFLLRDSLGGNAKTVIIACVHPGVKCFGETLSTLHFARRAKMIKNKAVVNEDAQGSVAHLQAEIKRLKETLQQYQVMPTTQISPASRARDGAEQISSDECVEEADVKQTSQWKKHFLKAMHFRQGAIQNQEHLEKKTAAIEARLQKLDNQLRSKDMVIKFRSNSLKIYQAAKNDRDLTDDEKTTIIENQRNEILALQEEVKLEQGIGVLKLENEKLKAENSWLKSKRTFAELDKRALKELEKTFDDLVAANLKEGNTSVVICTPHEGSDKISSATIERHKAQVDALQKEIEKYKIELQGHKEDHEKEVIKLRAELDSWKTRYEEVAAVQKSQCISGQIEREERDRIHMETIKNLTPKKLPHNLRSRNVTLNSPGAKAPVFCLDDSGEGVDILSEKQPMAMFETLEEEMKKIREENQQLHLKVEERDRLLVEKASEVSKLLSESTQLQKILEKERTEWSIKTKEYSAKVEQLTKDLCKQQDDNQNLLGYKTDMDIMMDAVEKSNKQFKKQNETLIQEREAYISALSTKVLQLENEKVKVDTVLTQTLQECDKLKESESAAQMTAMYLEDQLSEAEQKHAMLEQDSTEMDKKYRDHMVKLSKVEERNSLLMKELEKASDDVGDKDKKLYELVCEQRKQESQMEVLRDELTQTQDNFSKVSEDLSLQKDEVKRLRKGEKEQKEVYQSMLGKLSEMKEQLEEAVYSKGVSEAHMAEATAREHALNAKLLHLEQTVSQQQESALEKEHILTRQETDIQRKMAQCDNMQEDLESTLIENDALKTDLQKAEVKLSDQLNEITKLSSECKSQQKLLESLKAESLAHETEFVKTEAESRNRCLQLEEKIHKISQEKEEFREELNSERSKIRNQYSTLANTQQQLGETEDQLNSLQASIAHKSTQITELQCRLERQIELGNKFELEAQSRQEQVESYRKNMQTLQSEHQRLCLSFQANMKDRDTKSEELDRVRDVIVSTEKKNKDMSAQLDMSLMRTATAEMRESELRSEMETVQSSLDALKSQHDSLHIKLSAMQHRIDETNQKYTDEEYECHRLRSIIEVKSKEIVLYEAEREELKEQLHKADFRIKELSDENASLGSHGNHLQKINLLHQRNQQVLHLTEEQEGVSPLATLLRQEGLVSASIGIPGAWQIPMKSDCDGAISQRTDLLKIKAMKEDQEKFALIHSKVIDKVEKAHKAVDVTGSNTIDDISKVLTLHIPPINTAPVIVRIREPPMNIHMDQDSVFDTFTSVSNVTATQKETEGQCKQEESTCTRTFETYHSAASAFERYSLQDINEVCDHSANKDRTIQTPRGKMTPLITSDLGKPELVRNAQDGASASHVSLFSVEESVVNHNQSHECLSSFETERVPSSTPKAQDEFIYNKTTKDISGFFVDDHNVISYNVPMARIVTTPTHTDENNNENKDQYHRISRSSYADFVKTTGYSCSETDWAPGYPLQERSYSEPSIFQTPTKRAKMRKSLSKVELFKFQTDISSQDLSQIVKALDIKIDTWQKNPQKQRVKSESQIFEEYDSPIVGPGRHSRKASEASNGQSKQGKSRSFFNTNFKMRAQKFRQSLRKSVMKRRSTKASSMSSGTNYHGRETEV